MEEYNNNNNTKKNDDFQKVLEIVFLFLKNNQFDETAETFLKECNKNNIALSNISGTVLYKCCQKIPCDQNLTVSDERVMLYTFLQQVEDLHQKENIMNNDDLRNQFRKLQEDYKCLLDVTYELTTLLQTNLEEQAKNVHHVLTQCQYHHPSLFQPIKKENVMESVKNEHMPLLNIEENYKCTATPQIEIREILESIVTNVSQKSDVQEVAKILEDILQEVQRTDFADSSVELESNSNIPQDHVKIEDSAIPHICDSEFGNKQKDSTIKNVKKHVLNFPKTPLCYLEICRKIEDGCLSKCRCMKCVPGQSRYYCSCYDAICEELEDKFEQEIDKPKTIFKDTKTKYRIEETCKICKEFKCRCAFKSRPKIGRSPPT